MEGNGRYFGRIYIYIYILTYLLTQRSRVLLEKVICSQLVKKLPAFMKPANSLPQLQVPAACSYTEPHRCIPCPYIQLPEYAFYYYHPIYSWVFQVVLSLRFPLQTSTLPIRSTCPIHLTIFDLITRNVNSSLSFVLNGF
jgi:hypothetical protein